MPLLLTLLSTLFYYFFSTFAKLHKLASQGLLFFFFWCATLAEIARKSRYGVSFVCLQEIEPPQTSGTERFWTSAPLPLSIGSLADHKPVSRTPAKQVIQELNLHIHTGNSVAAGRRSQRKARSKNKRRPKCLRNDTLPSQSAKGAFLSIVSGLKKLCDSINWGKRSLNFITLRFPQVARRSAAPQPKCDKRRHKFYTQARWGWPSRPFIFSYLFIPDCKFMRILLSFQLWLLPPLDEEKKKEHRPSLGLGVFLLPPHNWLSMREEENLNYSACEAMAPPSELEPVRMCSSFPLFQLGRAREKLYSTRAGSLCNTLVSKSGVQGAHREPRRGPYVPPSELGMDSFHFDLMNKKRK